MRDALGCQHAGVPTDLTTTPNTTIRRKPERGRYDRATVDAILDEAFVAHVGIAVDGQPFVIPMACGRVGDRLLLHGSVASRLLRSLDRGVRVCVTVTLIDGLVLAHSQRNHSLNYRCAVVLGTATRLRGDEATSALARIVDHIVPGRVDEARCTDRRRAARHDGALGPDRRGVGQGPHRAAGRGERRRPGRPALDGRRPRDADPRHAGPHRGQP